MLWQTPNVVTGKEHFGGAQYALSHFGMDTKVTVYTGVIALAINLVVTFVVTLFTRWKKLPDQTERGDYELEAGDPGVEPLELDEEQAERTPAPSAR
jgi:SSS family solute:Na+ symporter